MEIIFVPSGEYKSFYINCFLKLAHCDLLVFNFGVIYDYAPGDNDQNSLVLSELFFLADRLNCVVVAGVYAKTAVNNPHERKDKIMKREESVASKNRTKISEEKAKSLKTAKGEDCERLILVCDREHFSLTPARVGARMVVAGKVFFVADETSKIRVFNKIILSKQRIYPNLPACGGRKIYLFCDDFGVTMVKNKKIQRKFNKFPKIILK